MNRIAFKIATYFLKTTTYHKFNRYKCDLLWLNKEQVRAQVSR